MPKPFTTSTFTFGFATVNILDHSIVELMINDGIEFNQSMFNEWKTWMETAKPVPQPWLILNNRKNRYSYSFDGLMELAKCDLIKALAIVYYDSIGKNVVAAALSSLPIRPSWNANMFPNREEAVNWLSHYK